MSLKPFEVFLPHSTAPPAQLDALLATFHQTKVYFSFREISGLQVGFKKCEIFSEGGFFNIHYGGMLQFKGEWGIPL